MEFVSGRLGRLILGDTPVSPMQNPTETDRGMGEQELPQPLEQVPRGFGPQVQEGVSMAERPRHRQIGCETCGQSFELYERKAKCQVCCLWIHEGVSRRYALEVSGMLRCVSHAIRKRRGS